MCQERKCSKEKECVCANSYNGTEVCNSSSPNGLLFCTREEGHEGQHIACGCEKHNLDSWK